MISDNQIPQTEREQLIQCITSPEVMKALKMIRDFSDLTADFGTLYNATDEDLHNFAMVKRTLYKRLSELITDELDTNM